MKGRMGGWIDEQMNGQTDGRWKDDKRIDDRWLINR